MVNNYKTIRFATNIIFIRYAGKQLICSFVNISNWKDSICGSFYFNRKCLKGRYCNYLHVYHNPQIIDKSQQKINKPVELDNHSCKSLNRNDESKHKHKNKYSSEERKRSPPRKRSKKRSKKDETQDRSPKKHNSRHKHSGHHRSRKHYK